MSLMEKLKKGTTIKESSILSKSKFFTKKDLIQTDVPIINVALGASLFGGFGPGITQWVGPSKHFKTSFSLLMAKAYLDKYKDAILLFYDSEFGTPQAYFESFNIDLERVFHTPLKNIEELKMDLVQQLDKFERGDKIIILIDSIGNLASKREIDNALSNKDSLDMTRAKELKSLFRMITPYLMLKEISLVAVNHSYKTLELYSKDVVGGGSGSYYSADNIYIIGRQQDKEGNDLAGYNFIIKVEKSRFVVEGSKFPVLVKFGKGISKWSGLIDIALDAGFIIKTKLGKSLAYSKVNQTTGEVSEDKFTFKKTENSAFWGDILANPKFNEFIENKYKISQGSILDDSDDSDDLEGFFDVDEDDDELTL